MGLTPELENPSVYLFVGSRLAKDKGFVLHSTYEELLTEYRKLKDECNALSTEREHKAIVNKLSHAPRGERVYRKEQEENYAISQREVAEGSKPEHKDGNQSGSTEKTVDCNRIEQGREVEQEIDSPIKLPWSKYGILR